MEPYRVDDDAERPHYLVNKRTEISRWNAKIEIMTLFSRID